MFDLLRPFLARVGAAIASGLSLWLLNTFGVELSPEDHEAISAVVITIVFTIYGIAHKLLSKKTNPTDGATTEMATKGVKK